MRWGTIGKVCLGGYFLPRPPDVSCLPRLKELANPPPLVGDFFEVLAELLFWNVGLEVEFCAVLSEELMSEDCHDDWAVVAS